MSKTPAPTPEHRAVSVESVESVERPQGEAIAITIAALAVGCVGIYLARASSVPPSSPSHWLSPCGHW